MTVEITLRTEKEEQGVSLPEGSPLKDILQERNLLEFPCGLGKCGKCLVYANIPACEEEVRRLGQDKVDAGLRLACYTTASQGLILTVPTKKSLQVLTSFSHAEYDFSPVLAKNAVTVPEARLENQQPDLQRLLAAVGTSQYEFPVSRLAALPDQLRSDKQVYAIQAEQTLLGVSTTPGSFAVVIDIGTTTVAAFLVDLEKEQVIAAQGQQNAQYPFGADVITRIQYAMENKKGTEPLQKAISNQITDLVHSLLKEVDSNELTFIACAGNTTMLHMLCGLPSENISKTPFIPVTLSSMRLPAEELGITVATTVFLVPGISSYIGADIVAALLAADAHHSNQSFLLVDLGTNAEIVLFVNGVFYACSAAAGPCFEGGTLSCGMAGQEGAIDSIFIGSEAFEYTTIGNTTPKGLCGSGVLDGIACMLEQGGLDETGRIQFPETPPGSSIREDADGRFLSLTKTVRITQKDIRQIQLGKAAVRAGIEVLLQEAGISVEEVQTLYLAGGFGSSLKPPSATAIGLFPSALADRITVLGNASSLGALRYTTEKNATQHAKTIIQNTQYIELSAHAAFMDLYIAHMGFPKK